jgi:hypothetical protein
VEDGNKELFFALLVLLLMGGDEAEKPRAPK